MIAAGPFQLNYPITPPSQAPNTLRHPLRAAICKCSGRPLAQLEPIGLAAPRRAFQQCWCGRGTLSMGWWHLGLRRAPSRGHAPCNGRSKPAGAMPAGGGAFDSAGFEEFPKVKFPKELNSNCRLVGTLYTENRWVRCAANRGCYLHINSSGSFSDHFSFFSLAWLGKSLF